MDLEEFVRLSLVQITKGVTDAQNEAMESGASVNPRVLHADHSSGSAAGRLADGRIACLVEFDVAVAVSEESSATGGGKLKAASFFQVGGNTSKGSTSESVSRLRFTVPVAFQTDPESYQQWLETER